MEELENVESTEKGLYMLATIIPTDAMNRDIPADAMNRNTSGRNELRPYRGSGITSPTYLTPEP